MTSDTVTVRRSLLAAAAGGCLLVGAAGAWLFVALTPTRVPASQVGAPANRSVPTAATPDAAVEQVGVSLTSQAVERAGITVAAPALTAEASTIAVPGIVEPNAYRKVVVTPLVAGKVTAIGADLGQMVRRGQELASVYSPELAEARSRVRAARAALDAHDRELQRTERLVAIGAASREELERIHAEHAAQVADVEAARARLQLLTGSAASENDREAGAASVTIRAPLDGTVIERAANVGANVDAGTALFTVADLSVVWVIADVYERDLSRVSVGSIATVTTPSTPRISITGRVSYIDPEIAAATRTAKLRIELPNPRQQLRFGMYVDVALAASTERGDSDSARVLTVPRTAVQSIGEQTVIYVVDPSSKQRFVERAVRISSASGDRVRVLSGLSADELLVVEGSFFIRAEIERLGLRVQAMRSKVNAQEKDATSSEGGARTSSVLPARPPIEVHVTTSGFEPSTVSVPVGMATTVRFLRTSQETCATEVAFPTLGIRKALPLNKPVEVQFTPTSGELTYVCGMNMLRGSVVAR